VSSSSSFSIHRVVALCLRIVLLVASFVIAGVLLVFGLAVALSMVLWNLLRGRRPGFVFRMKSPNRPGARRGGGASSHDVVDVETRELPDDTPRR
jgi:hypothetical protein